MKTTDGLLSWFKIRLDKLRRYGLRVAIAHVWKETARRVERIPLIHWLNCRDHRVHPWLIDPDYLHASSLTASIKASALYCEGVIVDYGCGDKPYRKLFPRATRYIGVDLGLRDPDDLKLNPDGSIPLDNESADGLLTTQVLEHVPDVQKYLHECARVLRPQGKLIVSTHGIWPYHPGGDVYGDYHRWTPAGLCREIELAGLQVLEVHKPCGGLLCVAQQFLVLSTPGQSKNPFFNLFMTLLSLMVNTPCAVLNWLAPKIMNRGDIVPICIVIKAQKNNPKGT